MGFKKPEEIKEPKTVDPEKLAKIEEIQQKIGRAFTELHFIDEELRENPDDTGLQQKRTITYQTWQDATAELARLEGKYGK